MLVNITYCGEYGKLYAQRKPRSFIAAFERLQVCTPRLSIKMRILSLPEAALSLSSHSMNLSTLTDFLNIIYGSSPFSLDIAASTASVGSCNLTISTVGFSLLRLHSTFLNVVLVTIVSSAYTVRNPAFLAFVKVRLRLAISYLATFGVYPLGTL